METRTHVAALFLALFPLTGAAQAQQPWEWRTPAVPGKTYPTKSAAAAAMRAADPAFANLTVEQGPEIGGSGQVFTYTGPDRPAEITPWTYESPIVRATEHATEQEAKDATLAKLAAANGSCPPPSIASEGNWTPRGFFSQPPISQYSNHEFKGLVVKTWVRSANVPHPCLDGNATNVSNLYYSLPQL